MRSRPPDDTGHSEATPDGRSPREDEVSKDSTRDLSSLSVGVPRRIGHYTIQSVIASGGMGTVYKAVQQSPRRVVAIKVMKAGVTSGSALRRFEYESQLLGRLRHPGIAQVYEAGTHGDGASSVPFFAMEYIPNARSITTYVKEKHLGTGECLELFTKVCDAVHHGHQKGIVHRDLKPSNILIGPNGNPRIIDFGVARATDSDMALSMMQTDVGQLVGTVQYMSPEQCQADPHDLDTRSDVYALGVVLYQLLCGRLPYEIGKCPIYEATRIIREQSPRSPSMLNPKLRGDLETIVLKAIEKERDRRYQSAVELAQDLRRYLTGDAISARPASLAYQLRVFARRNKGMLTAAAAIFLVVLTGAVVSTALYFHSETNRLRAEQQQQKAADAETYLQNLVSAINPAHYGGQVKVSELLDRYGEKIEEQFGDQSEVEATVRAALARSYIFLNLIERGERSEASWQAAEDHLNAALAIRREALGDDHPDTLEIIEQIAGFLGYGRDMERAERMAREAFETRERKYGAEEPATLVAGLQLGELLLKREKFDEAHAFIARVVETRGRVIGEDHPATVDSMYELARALQGQGRLDEAEQVSLRVLEARQRPGGGDSKAVKGALGALASVYVAQGKLDQARGLFEAKVGTDDLGIEKWLKGEGTIAIDRPTVVVFWESWCPFSQLFVPELGKISSGYDDEDLQVVGLTSLSKGTSEAEARDFVERNGLRFPNATSNGQLHSQLGFTGWPQAVAVKGGDVVWAGHPNQLSQRFFDGLIAGGEE